MNPRMLVLIAILSTGCANDPAFSVPDPEEARQSIDSIQVLDRDVRVYGPTAALRWHANFHVHVNGEPSFAEMRLLVGNPPGD